MIMYDGPNVANPHQDPIVFHDITGDGLSDAITWGPGSISVFVNQDGRTWGGPYAIDVSNVSGWDPDPDEKNTAIFSPT